MSSYKWSIHKYIPRVSNVITVVTYDFILTSSFLKDCAKYGFQYLRWNKIIFQCFLGVRTNRHFSRINTYKHTFGPLRVKAQIGNLQKRMSWHLLWFWFCYEVKDKCLRIGIVVEFQIYSNLLDLAIKKSVFQSLSLLIDWWSSYKYLENFFFGSCNAW